MGHRGDVRVVQANGAFEVTTEAVADGLVVRLGGEMDLTAEDPFRSAVVPLLPAYRAGQVTVDCGSLGFVALAGLDLLFEATLRCQPGGRISLVSPPATLVRLLDFTAARSRFTVVGIREDAVSRATV